MALMTLAEARSKVDDLLLAGANANSDARIDRRLMIAGRQMARTVPDITRKISATADLTADKPELDISSWTAFDRERLRFTYVEYTDQGTWTTSTAYLKNDLVTGDGSPDALFYRCLQDHTSSASDEPGGSGDDDYWTRVDWKRGFRLTKVPMQTIDDLINENTVAAQTIYVNGTDVTFTRTGRPLFVSYLDNDTLNVYPIPDTRYTIRAYYHEPFSLLNSSGAIVTYTPGITDSSHTLNIDDEYATELASGAAALMEYENPSQGFKSASWAEFLRSIREIAARRKGDSATVIRKNPAHYD